MENKTIIIAIILIFLISIAVFFWYRMKLSESSPYFKVDPSCYEQSIKMAQEKYREDNPTEKENIEKGIYLKVDREMFYRECLGGKN